MSLTKYITFLTIIFSFCIEVNAKNMVIEFDSGDFRFSYNENGDLFVGCDDLRAFYSEEVPYALPSFMYEVEIEGNVLPSVKINRCDTSNLFSSVNVASKPKVSSLSMENGEPEYKDISFSYGLSNAIKEIEICKVVGHSNLGNGKSKVNLIINPFVYGTDHSLELITSFELELLNTYANDMPVTNYKEAKLKEYGLRLKEYLARQSTKSREGNNDYGVLRRPNSDRWDYLIFTFSNLSESFVPLMEWKEMKGITTAIISIDEIMDGSFDKPEETLKWAIGAACEEFSTKYILLGGDESIIPVKKCYGLVTDLDVKETYDIPTDLFYSCFGGSFDWDGNNNGISGELGDGIDLNPSVYLTRIPVRTPEEVEAFVSKVIKYEQNPEINMTMLMCGRSLGSLTTTFSDSDRKGYNLLNNHISKLWDGKVTRLYDTSTSFPGNGDYPFSVTNFVNEWEKGYGFLDIITAGLYNAWVVENNLYLCLNADKQKNSGSTVVVSTSDNCNAFDLSSTNSGIDQSVSEFIIKAPDNGVIAFLGSSRETWEYVGSSELGPNLQYNAWFYHYLFSNPEEEKNYGRIVSLAKSMLSGPSYQSYGPYRWLQFALNPIGDPETPIFVTNPESFSDTYYKMLGGGRMQFGLKSNQGRICIKSLEDDGKSIYDIYENASYISGFELSRETSICVTKPGYIPYCIMIYNFQNQILKDRELKGDLVTMGSNVLPGKDNGIVKIQGNVKISAPHVEIYGGTEVSSGTKFEIR